MYHQTIKKRTILLKKHNFNSKSRKKYSYQKILKKIIYGWDIIDKEKKYKLERDYERRKKKKTKY